MEANSLFCLADGTELPVPHRIEELLEVLEHARRYGEMAGLELAGDGGVVWINPDQVVAARSLDAVSCSCCGEPMEGLANLRPEHSA
jgi:hypothetical protein